jgi:hypothetical protein
LSQPAFANGARSNLRSARFSATLMPATQALRSGSSVRQKTLCRRISARVAR